MSGFSSARKKPRLLSDTEKKLIKEAFDLFDANKDGYLDYYELKASTRCLGFELKKPELLTILQTYDRDNTNLINYEDFYEIMEEKMQKRDRTEEVKEAFKLIANDKTNCISFRDLKYAADRVGADIPDRDLRNMIEEFDTKGEGKLDEEDFINVITDLAEILSSPKQKSQNSNSKADKSKSKTKSRQLSYLSIMDRLDWEQANRNTVLEGTEALLRTAESLERSRRIAEESEEIGTTIIADLGTQRESLERARGSLHNTNNFLVQSQKILNSMYKRVFTNKFILILIILTEVIILGAAVYLKFLKKH